MSEPPEIPPPLPRAVIPRTPLWIAFSVPPVAILVGNVIANSFRTPEDYGTPFLWVPAVVFFLIVACLPVFHQAMASRYRGRSLVFLDCGYFLGQIIVCLSVWMGSCMIFFS